MAISTILLDIMPASYTTEYAADPARINRFIGYAQNEVNQTEWGDKYEAGVAYLAAHKIALKDVVVPLLGEAGQVVERKVDNATTKFADQTGAVGDHAETTYGREFDRMQSNLLILPRNLYSV